MYNGSQGALAMFQDRYDAGRQLARKLDHYAAREDVIILALPRGGVPVGYEVANWLRVPLDLFLVRKLGVPGYEELAMGAIASGGVSVLNKDVIKELNITRQEILKVVSDEVEELKRRELVYRGNRPPLSVRDKIAILVDDGLATGSTMRAAVMALRRLEPAMIVVAVPVGAPDTCAKLELEADEVVCLHTPRQLRAVGHWYADFGQTTDDEVQELLTHHSAAAE